MKTWSLNRILIVVVIIIVMVNMVVIALSLVRRGENSATSYAMQLTQPVMFINGTVRKIDNNTITISYHQPSADIKESQELLFTVVVPEKASISKSDPLIPYSFKTTPTAVNRAITTGDIRLGDEITVYSLTDLRTLTSGTIIPQSITVNPKNNTVSGFVQSVSGNSITVKGIRQSASPLVEFAPREEILNIALSNETEIVEMSPVSETGASVLARKTARDIAPGNQVLVYFAQGPSTGTVNGLLVQIQPQVIVEDTPARTSTSSATVTSPTAVPVRDN